MAGAVVNAVLDVVTEAQFIPRIQRMGELCLDRLASHLEGHPAVAAIRGRGLMMGVELKTMAHAGELVIEAAKRRLLVAFCLTAPNVIRIYPPAMISDADLLDGIDRFCASVQALPATSPETTEHA